MPNNPHGKRVLSCIPSRNVENDWNLSHAIPAAKDRPKRATYHPPVLGKLGKLTHKTNAVDLTGMTDGGVTPMSRT